jgi:hypothetical protein
MRNTYLQNLVGNPEGKRPHQRPMCKWENSINFFFFLENKNRKLWTGFIWLRIGQVVGLCEHSIEPSGCINNREFLN